MILSNINQFNKNIQGFQKRAASALGIGKIVYNSVQNVFYTGNTSNSYHDIEIYDGTTFEKIGVMNTQIYRERGMIYNPANNRLYITCFGAGGSVAVFDCSTNALVEYIPTPGWPNTMYHMTLAPEINKIFVPYGYQWSGGFITIDCNTNTYTHTFQGYGWAVSSAYDPKRNQLWITTNNNASNSNIIAFDIATQGYPYAVQQPYGSFVFFGRDSNLYDADTDSVCVLDESKGIRKISCDSKTIVASATEYATNLRDGSGPIKFGNQLHIANGTTYYVYNYSDLSLKYSLEHGLGDYSSLIKVNDTVYAANGNGIFEAIYN